MVHLVFRKQISFKCTAYILTSVQFWADSTHFIVRQAEFIWVCYSECCSKSDSERVAGCHFIVRGSTSAVSPLFTSAVIYPHWRGSDDATPNTPLCHDDYFELNATEKQQILKRLSTVPHDLQAGHTFSFMNVSPLHCPILGRGDSSCHWRRHWLKSAWTTLTEIILIFH